MRLADAAMRRVVDPVVVAILRSPLHAALSRHVLLVEVVGRRTGTLRRIPVTYRRQDGTLVVRTLPSRQWWRNLTPGRAVRLLVGGRELDAHAEVAREDEHVVVRLTPLTPAGSSPAVAGRRTAAGFPQPAVGDGRMSIARAGGTLGPCPTYLPRPC
jgi:deazaflavin-dependent oxidoreductase (nitroreductase family)